MRHAVSGRNGIIETGRNAKGIGRRTDKTQMRKNCDVEIENA